jgi:plastocyanin
VTTRIALTALLAALLLPSALARADNPRLVAVVGTNDAFAISLRDASGNLVSQLDPGTYEIAVSDRSEIHNFHLSGPGGVDMATAVEQKQEVTWTLTLTDGRYTFVCDEHASTMRGSFIVGNVPEPTKLTGTVGPRRTISLRDGQGKLTTIQAGAVVLTVNDRTRTDNFHLTGPGVNRKTGVVFRGRVSWKLTLQPGRYTYRSDKHKSLRGTFTATPTA